MQVKIKIYVGQKDETFSDSLFVDLMVGENGVTLYEEDIDGVDAEDFGETIAIALETSKHFAENLQIPIKIDSGVAEIIEEFEENDRIRIKRLILEYLDD